MSHGSVAKSVRLAKERRPQDYCSNPSCLWRRVVTVHGGPDLTHTEIRPCPRHEGGKNASSR